MGESNERASWNVALMFLSAVFYIIGLVGGLVVVCVGWMKLNNSYEVLIQYTTHQLVFTFEVHDISGYLVALRRMDSTRSHASHSRSRLACTTYHLHPLPTLVVLSSFGVVCQLKQRAVRYQDIET